MEKIPLVIKQRVQPKLKPVIKQKLQKVKIPLQSKTIDFDEYMLSGIKKCCNISNEDAHQYHHELKYALRNCIHNKFEEYGSGGSLFEFSDRRYEELLEFNNKYKAQREITEKQLKDLTIGDNELCEEDYDIIVDYLKRYLVSKGFKKSAEIVFT